MKLSKIYSNQKDFKVISFNDGFNVIFGDIMDTDTEGSVEEHNLGKTSLVHLIDFLLLKRLESENFLIKFSEKFLNWEFYLEIKLNDGSFLTIRRSVGNYNLVAFKSHTTKDQDFVDEEEWDYKDLQIYSRDDRKSPTKILESEYLKFDVLNNYPFRTFLNYLLRTQDDYVDVFKLNSFKGADSNWKPQILELLGYNPELLDKKYELDEDIKLSKKLVARLKDTNEDDKYAIRAAIGTKKEERKSIESLIDRFDFYKNDDELNKSLVTEVESKISLLNDRKYAISYDIEEIQSSLSMERPHDIGIEQLQGFFDELKVHFEDSLKKEYSDVIEFTKQLSEERQVYLKDQLKTLKQQLKNTNIQLRSLNDDRARILSTLTQKDSFRKFKSYQAGLATIDGEIFHYEQQLRDIDRIELFKEEQEKLGDSLKELKKQITVMLESDPQPYLAIRSLFTKIYKTVFEYTGTLAVKMNTAGNVSFEPVVLDAGDALTGKSHGNTSRHVMCASFILAVMAAYSDKSFFRFAYNDGVMEGWGDSHKRSFIKLVREYAEDYDIQFITSMINSDMPSNFSFKEGEVVRTLSKTDTLFGVDF